jgi:uncharacterized protein YcfJ
MNKSMLSGVILGGAAALSIGAVASYKVLKEPDYAQILAVTPVNKTVETQEEVCADAQVSRKAPVSDEQRIAGTVIGGLIGGVVGHQIGSGAGNKLATVAGAAGGAYAGNQVQKNMQDSDTRTSTERRCKIVSKAQQKVVGYDVRYSLNGEEFTERTSTRPSGKRLLVEDGKLVLDEAGAAKP